jgi:hypothetical protein
MARELLKIASDPNASEAVRVNAIKDALDRAGVSARTAVDVSVTAKPYETILERLEPIAGGSRAEHRRTRGIEETSPALVDPALPPANPDAPIDAEVMDDGDEFLAAMRSHRQVDVDAHPMTPGDAEHARDERTAAEMMTLEDAVVAAAEMRRGPRALPPGRSS